MVLVTACCLTAPCHYLSQFHIKWYESLQVCEYYTLHYSDVIMGMIASQITSLTIVYSTVYSDTDQSKHQSSGSLAFVWGIQRGPVNSPHKWPVTRKMFSFDDVIMEFTRFWVYIEWCMYSSGELFKHSSMLFGVNLVLEESTYIILSFTWHNESINDDKMKIFTHRPLVR